MGIEDARKAIGGLFRCQAVRSQCQSIWMLCQTHPSLALESFDRHGRQISPLMLFLEEGMDLVFVQEFCREFPQSVETPHYDTGNFPLHVACATVAARRPIPGLVAFLVHQFPRAAAVKNARGDLPLHMLLDGSATTRSTRRCCSTDDVTSLVEAYPEGTVMTSVDRRSTPLDTVLEVSNQFSQTVRDTVCSRVPKKVRFFQLKNQLHQRQPQQLQLNNNQRHNQRQTSLVVSTALSKLLPQLTVLECKHVEWDLEGWTFLLSCLETNTSIRYLSLNLPTTTTNIVQAKDYIDPLTNCLARNTSVTKLSLLHRHPTTTHAMTAMWDETVDYTTLVQAILHANTVTSLTLVGTAFDTKQLTLALAHNTSLTEWNLEGCSKQQVDFCQLDVALENHNTSLKRVTVPPSRYRQDILYWTAMNRFGRKYIRKNTASLEQVIVLLATLKHMKYVIQQGQRVERHQIYYGLLREAPSLWCH
ncbi:expressed unknown protein [Seminavis robusta]|uniref:Uncharacterized protein n=1 Tax=Seminavis robusta TaxID=568900 RepID=A0A9N8F0B5_9STRA|nr:expressed unknown protein [Seminavis robusta]|eukprot:Sro2126_g315730.1 n/a (475) ;mRNA; r:14095-15519